VANMPSPATTSLADNDPSNPKDSRSVVASAKYGAIQHSTVVRDIEVMYT
jgi:hypothetical protein